MEHSDPDAERRRIAGLYSSQSDGELQTAAAEGYGLSELAREALRAEIEKRGLQTQILQYPSGDEAELRQRVTLRQFRDLPEALLAKGALESASIDCALVDDNMVRLDWFYSTLVGGVKLQVDADDAQVADEILRQPIPETFNAGEAEDYSQPKCPKCGSLDINFQELDPAAYVSLGISYFAVAMPAPIQRQAWRCHSCNAEWVEEGAPDAPASPA